MLLFWRQKHYFRLYVNCLASAQCCCCIRSWYCEVILLSLWLPLQEAFKEQGKLGLNVYILAGWTEIETFTWVEFVAKFHSHAPVLSGVDTMSRKNTMHRNDKPVGSYIEIIVLRMCRVQQHNTTQHNILAPERHFKLMFCQYLSWVFIGTILSGARR